MNFPQHVIDLVSTAAKQHPGDNEAATDVAETRIRRLKDFDEIRNFLIRHAIQDLVLQARDSTNMTIRNNCNCESMKVYPENVVIGLDLSGCST